MNPTTKAAVIEALEGLIGQIEQGHMATGVDKSPSVQAAVNRGSSALALLRSGPEPTPEPGERERFEAWPNETQPPYWRTTAWAREAWPIWQAARASLPPAPEPVAGWQPIDSAPKDGTEVLLYAPATVYEGTPVEARLTYGHWSAPSDTPRLKYVDGFAPEPVYEDWEPYWASWDGGFTEESPPTHWRALPPAPTKGTE